MLALYEAAIGRGLFSAPHIPFLPDNFPISLAIVAVQLIDGCLPPNGERARAGTGTGPTQADAVFKAMCEASERFSLQYDPDRPDVRWPVESLQGAGEPLPQATLCLGAPNGRASSKGCAAGDSLEDAVNRAALEILEHYELKRLRTGVTQGVAFDPATIPKLTAAADYLAKRLRQLRAVAVVSPTGYAVVWAVSCDPDGGRPTEGSAAAASVEAATIKAVEEAIFSWRNMIELERNGVAPTDGQHDRILRTYRGAEAVSPTLPVLVRGKGPPRLRRICQRPLEILAGISGTRTRVFDMTSPLLGVPVVRVVLD